MIKLMIEVDDLGVTQVSSEEDLAIPVAMFALEMAKIELLNLFYDGMHAAKAELALQAEISAGEDE